MSVTFEVRGLKELEAKLLELKDVGGLKAVARAGRKAMAHVEAAAKAKAPVDSGELRDAIRIAVTRPPSGPVVASIGLKLTKRRIAEEMTDEGGGTRTVTREVDAGWRWHFAEFGTAHHAPTPFLRPAFDENVGKVVATLREALALEVKRLERKRARGTP